MHLFSDNFLNARLLYDAYPYMNSQWAELILIMLLIRVNAWLIASRESVGLYSTGAHVCRQCTVIHCAIFSNEKILVAIQWFSGKF